MYSQISNSGEIPTKPGPTEVRCQRQRQSLPGPGRATQRAAACSFLTTSLPPREAVLRVLSWLLGSAPGHRSEPQAQSPAPEPPDRAKPGRCWRQPRLPAAGQETGSVPRPRRADAARSPPARWEMQFREGRDCCPPRGLSSSPRHKELR